MLQFSFVTILRMAQRRQRRLSSLDFESTPSRTNPLMPVFRESRFSATESSCTRHFSSQKPLEHAAIK
jgi:hypothetical protein